MKFCPKNKKEQMKTKLRNLKVVKKKKLSKNLSYKDFNEGQDLRMIYI